MALLQNVNVFIALINSHTTLILLLSDKMDERKLSYSMQSAELTSLEMLKIKQIEEKIAPFAEALANHNIYDAIKTIEDLRIFMAHHIFCVWDFMNLIKEGFNDFLAVWIRL